VARLRQAPKGKRHPVCNLLRKAPIKRFELIRTGKVFQQTRRKNDASDTHRTR